MTITEAAVERMVPEPNMPEGEGEELDRIRKVMADGFISARASARNTVYPCRVCRPFEFARWAGRHWESDHDRSECEECSSGVRAPARKAKTADDDRVPADVRERRDLM